MRHRLCIVCDKVSIYLKRRVQIEPFIFCTFIFYCAYVCWTLRTGRTWVFSCFFNTLNFRFSFLFLNISILLIPLLSIRLWTFEMIWPGLSVLNFIMSQKGFMVIWSIFNGFHGFAILFDIFPTAIFFILIDTPSYSAKLCFSTNGVQELSLKSEEENPISEP